jgi:hypothetical protein
MLRKKEISNPRKILISLLPLPPELSLDATSV